MYCLCVEYPMPAAPEQFRAYYAARHLPLASRLPGLLSYEVAYPKSFNESADVPFCIFRGYFASAEAMEQALFSETGAEVAADVPNYSPTGCRMYHHPVALSQLAAA